MFLNVSFQCKNKIFTNLYIVILSKYFDRVKTFIYNHIYIGLINLYRKLVQSFKTGPFDSFSIFRHVVSIIDEIVWLWFFMYKNFSGERVEISSHSVVGRWYLCCELFVIRVVFLFWSFVVFIVMICEIVNYNVIFFNTLFGGICFAILLHFTSLMTLIGGKLNIV